YEDHGNFVYNKLDELGLIKLDLPTKQQIYDQAKLQLINKNNPELAINRSEFKELSKTLELINNQTEGRLTIQNEAKKIALHVVFEEFKKNNINLNELLNQEHAF